MRKRLALILMVAMVTTIMSGCMQVNIPNETEKSVESKADKVKRSTERINKEELSKEDLQAIIDKDLKYLEDKDVIIDIQTTLDGVITDTVYMVKKEAVMGAQRVIDGDLRVYSTEMFVPENGEWKKISMGEGDTLDTAVIQPASCKYGDNGFNMILDKFHSYKVESFEHIGTQNVASGIVDGLSTRYMVYVSDSLNEIDGIMFDYDANGKASIDIYRDMKNESTTEIVRVFFEYLSNSNNELAEKIKKSMGSSMDSIISSGNAENTTESAKAKNIEVSENEIIIDERGNTCYPVSKYKNNAKVMEEVNAAIEEAESKVGKTFSTGITGKSVNMIEISSEEGAKKYKPGESFNMPKEVYVPLIKEGGEIELIYVYFYQTCKNTTNTEQIYPSMEITGVLIT